MLEVTKTIAWLWQQKKDLLSFRTSLQIQFGLGLKRDLKALIVSPLMASPSDSVTKCFSTNPNRSKEGPNVFTLHFYGSSAHDAAMMSHFIIVDLPVPGGKPKASLKHTSRVDGSSKATS